MHNIGSVKNRTVGGCVANAVVCPVGEIVYRSAPDNIIPAALGAAFGVVRTVDIKPLFTAPLKNPRFSVRNMLPKRQIRIG